MLRLLAQFLDLKPRLHLLVPQLLGLFLGSKGLKRKFSLVVRRVFMALLALAVLLLPAVLLLEFPAEVQRLVLRLVAAL